MEDEQATSRISHHLKIGIGAIVVAAGYVAYMLLLGWEYHSCLLLPLVLLLLVAGGTAVLCGVVSNANQGRIRPWVGIGVLGVILVLLILLSVGPGNYFNLLDLGGRLTVTLSGGQEELRAWAIKILDEPRDNPGQVSGERIPRERWSEQVRRLRPRCIQIDPLFEDRHEAVRLCYGSGFFHWNIVVGRPGSRPDPSLNDPNSDDRWLRWGDGIYGWQQP
jgi:hypothetical protein